VTGQCVREEGEEASGLVLTEVSAVESSAVVAQARDATLSGPLTSRGF